MGSERNTLFHYLTLKRVRASDTEQTFGRDEKAVGVAVSAGPRLTSGVLLLCGSAAVLERDFLLSRERERKLQTELEAVMACFRRQEQLNTELRARQEQLVGRIQQQQVSLSGGRRKETMIVRMHFFFFWCFSPLLTGSGHSLGAANLALSLAPRAGKKSDWPAV